MVSKTSYVSKKVMLGMLHQELRNCTKPEDGKRFFALKDKVKEVAGAPDGVMFDPEKVLTNG